MSTGRWKRCRGGDEGFSLIEIVIAMGLLTAVMLSSLPMLLGMMRSTVVTKMNTQAKNLSQERLEQLRDLRFHVDRQNGPFLDLLDLYYTNATVGATTSIPSGAGTLTGRYIATGTSNGVAAPLYETATGALAGANQYSQVVLAQFLAADGSVLPASRFEGLYDSQIVGKDTPPSLVVRFTTVTSWVQAGETKTYRTTTVITEGGPEAPVIQTQAKAAAVTVGSTARDASTLQLQAGLANLDGAQASGSEIAGYVTGASVTRSGQAAVTGKVGQFSLPGQAVTTSGGGGAVDPGGCSWYAFGANNVSNVSAKVTSGIPQAPSDVDAATPPNVLTGALSQGSAHSCGLFSFDNLVGGGTPRTDALGTLMGGAPFVRAPDSSASGSGISGSAYVTATPLTATSPQSKSGARVLMGQPVVIFPGHAASAGQGLVSARLVSASVDCVSGTSTTSGTVRGKYTLELGWWGKVGSAAPSWKTRTYTYDSSSATPLTETGSTWEPQSTILSDGVTRLSDVVQVTVPSASSGVVNTGATTGLRGFPGGILTLTTAPTLSTESAPGHSAVRVDLGTLTCVADDQR